MPPTSPKLQKLLGSLVMLLVPVTLLLGGINLELKPWFVHFQYNVPGFPDDPFGFTKRQRVQYALVAVDYLVNEWDISYLADMRFEGDAVAPANSCFNPEYGGDCTRMYNDRELQHMLDVKILVRRAMAALSLALGVLALLGVWAWARGWFAHYLRWLGRGGWLTAGLIVTMLAVIAIAFRWLFVHFHEIFFSAGTWMFYWSDTLIRLFPEMFWQNAFIVVGVFALAGGLLLGWLFERPVKSWQANRRR